MPKHWLIYLGLFAMVPVSAAEDPPRCHLSLSRDLTISQQVVSQGGTLSTQFTARSGGGEWRLQVVTPAENGRIVRVGKFQWTVEQGDSEQIITTIEVGEEVPAGEFSISVNVRANAKDCVGDDRETKLYPFRIQVIAPGTVRHFADPLLDTFIAATGTPLEVSGDPSLDLIGVEAEWSPGLLEFTLLANGAFPGAAADNPRRVGCYIDVDGNAELAFPFNPIGFEYLAVADWFPLAPFAQLARIDPAPSAIDIGWGLQGAALLLQVPTEALGDPASVQLACFSEFTLPTALVVDVVPNQGLAVFGSNP